MDFDFPSKLQELPVLLIIPFTLALKKAIKKHNFEVKEKTLYQNLMKYLEVFLFFGLIILSLFDKLLSVFSLFMFFLYSLDQSIRLISLGIKNMIKKTDENNSKILIIGVLILANTLLLSYISIKNIVK